MGTAQQLAQIKVNISDAKHMVKLAAALEKLKKNENFRLLIEQGYFIEEAARLVAAKSNIAMQSTEQQRFLDSGIMGLGSLQQFFIKIDQMGDRAKDSIEADENTEAELLGMGE